MNKKIIIGVMGASNASKDELLLAEKIGEEIAQRNLVLLTGGAPVGIMEAASKGASKYDGVVVGIIMGKNNKDGNNFSKYINIPIFTDMNKARNIINILSSDIVIIPTKISNGTLEEIALSISYEKKIILMSKDKKDIDYFKDRSKKIYFSTNIEDTFKLIDDFIKECEE